MSTKARFLCTILLFAIILSITNVIAIAGTLTYEYDKLNRPIKEIYSDGTVINYTYDEFGNQKQVYLSPFVDFKASSVRDFPPFAVNFADLSPGTPTSWHWDFGDSTTSTQQNPLHTYSSIGAYTVSLTVTNASGTYSHTKQNYINVRDITTSITSSPPPVTNSSTATFSFSASQPDATFLCQLDGGAFLPCASPHLYSSLAGGAHIFAVKAVGATGFTYHTAATYSWNRDVIPPDTSFTMTPPASSAPMNGTFSFNATEPGSKFECKMDEGNYLACISSYNYSLLSNGAHSFHVRATDQVGNVDPTPVTYFWIVSPDTVISARPEYITKGTSSTFAFYSHGTGVSFECKIDGGAFEGCSSPYTLNGLYYGNHTFTVRAKDQAGNVDANPPTYSWTTIPVNVLDVAKPGNGLGTVTGSTAGISCGSVCSNTFASPAAVELTAVPAIGSQFVGWSGDCSGNTTCTVLVDKPTSVSAIFTIPESPSSVPGVSAGTWESIGPSGGIVDAMVIDPDNSANLYAVLTGHGVMKSTDSGISWNTIFPPLENNSSYGTLALDARDPQQKALYLGTGWSGTTGGLYKAALASDTNWLRTPTLPNDSFNTVTFDPSNPSVMYALNYYDKAYKTGNSGQSWDMKYVYVYEGTGLSACSVHPAEPNTIYVGSLCGGVLKSTNGGSNWFPVNAGFQTVYGGDSDRSDFYHEVRQLVFDPRSASNQTHRDTIYACMDDALYKTVDGGGLWNKIFEFPCSSFAIDAGNANIMYVSSNVGRGNVFQSVDGGVSWYTIGANLNAVAEKITIDPRNSSIIDVTTHGSGIFRYMPTVSPTALGTVRDVTFVDSWRVYAATSDGIQRSIDNGFSWQSASSGLPIGFSPFTVRVDPTDPEKVYAAGEGGVYLSTNGGTSWTFSGSGLPVINQTLAVAERFSTILIDPSTPTTLYVGTKSGVYKSTNSGGTWSAAKSGLPQPYPYVTESEHGNRGRSVLAM